MTIRSVVKPPRRTHNAEAHPKRMVTSVSGSKIGQTKRAPAKKPSKIAEKPAVEKPKPAPRPKGYQYLVLSGNNSRLVKQVLKSRPWWSAIEDEGSNLFHFKWKQSGGGLQYRTLSTAPGRQQAVNHVPSNRELCTKTGMFRNLQTLLSKGKRNVKLSDIIPDTYEFSTTADVSFIRWKKRFSDTARRVAADQKVEPGTELNLWIAKPESLNRGRGIQVIRSVKELEAATSAANNPTKGSWIVQKYIENPMLINDRKFDIRQYVLVTNTLDVYFYREGYLRLCSVPYRTDTTDDAVHLTNNAVQRKLEGYGEHEEGNQMTYDEMAAVLVEQGGPTMEAVRDEMKRQVGLCIESVASKLNPERLKAPFFEIFGFDFMLHGAPTFQVVTIEVNTNPCLDQSSAILKKLLPEMLDDAFALTLDKSHPAPRGKGKSATVVKDGEVGLDVGQPPVLHHQESEFVRGNRFESMGSFLRG